jgi:hypothetical protein
MNPATHQAPPVRAAFDAFIDYAGLFPPATLDVATALSTYLSARRGPHAWMLGRFIVPASRAADVAAHLGEGNERLPLSVIADISTEPRAWFESLRRGLDAIAGLISTEARVHVSALEVPIAPLATQRETFDATIGQLGALIARAGLSHLEVYGELPRGPRWAELLPGAMAAFARAGLRAKLRCGGTTAQAFPSITEVAAFIEAAMEAGVAFKATAGLHHPVRHVDAQTGFPMHGFLNLLGATAFSGPQGDNTVEAVLSETDPASFGFDQTSFTWREHSIGTAELKAVRTTAFTAYGSCSFDEPVDDLTGLGMLAR